MPPELPQTCSCLQQPRQRGLLPFRRWARARSLSPRLATANRVLPSPPEYDETKDRMIPGLTIERRRTER